jgi:hypothetical protein
MIKVLARLLLASSMLVSSAAALACSCGPVESRDLDDLATQNAHVALVRVSGVELARESQQQSVGISRWAEPGTRLYGEPYRSGVAIARYVLIERIKGLKSNGLPRLEYEVGSGCSSGVAPGDFLLLFWDEANTVLQQSACEPRIVNLGNWLGLDRLLLADLRENVKSGRPMHPCDLSSGMPRDDQQCVLRRKKSMELDKKQRGL